MLVDTDVLVWFLCGNRKAAKLIDGLEGRQVSVITHMELLQGARDRADLRTIKSFLADTGFEIVPLSENIGHRASIYVEEYGLKAGMRVADALIAATAVELGSDLCTGDTKHYKAIHELGLRPFRP